MRYHILSHYVFVWYFICSIKWRTVVHMFGATTKFPCHYASLSYSMLQIVTASATVEPSDAVSFSGITARLRFRKRMRCGGQVGRPWANCFGCGRCQQIWRVKIWHGIVSTPAASSGCGYYWRFHKVARRSRLMGAESQGWHRGPALCIRGLSRALSTFSH